MLRAGRAVRHHHFAEPGAEQHRPLVVAVAVGHLVEGEAVGGVHRHPEAPFLPRDLVAVDLEAHALGLHDVEGLEVVAHRSDRLGVVVAAPLGERHRLGVDEVDHRPFGEVDGRHHTLDRVGVAVVGLVVAHVGDHSAHPLPRPVVVEVPGRPGIALHGIEVLDAPTPHGRSPTFVLLDDEDRLEQFLEEDHVLAARGFERHHLVVREGDDRGPALAGGAVDQERHRPAIPRVARRPRHQLDLRGLSHGHGGEAMVFSDLTGLAQDPDRAGDLLFGQRLERVGGRFTHWRSSWLPDLAGTRPTRPGIPARRRPCRPRGRRRSRARRSRTGRR